MKNNQTLLIIDDALFMRELLRETLEDLFCKIVVAENEHEARHQFSAEKPDLTTLDLTLDSFEPVKGLTLLKQLLTIQPEAKIIVVSALNQPWLQEEVMDHGALAYIPKPFEKSHIKNIAHEVLTNGGR